MTKPISKCCGAKTKDLLFQNRLFPQCTRCGKAQTTYLSMLKSDIKENEPRGEAKCQKCHVRECKGGYGCNAPVKGYCPRLTCGIKENEKPIGSLGIEQDTNREPAEPLTTPPHSTEEGWEKDAYHYLTVMFGLGLNEERDEANKCQKEAMDFFRQTRTEAVEQERRRIREAVEAELEGMGMSPKYGEVAEGFNQAVELFKKKVLSLLTPNEKRK